MCTVPFDVRHIIRLGAARIAAGIGHGAPDADLAGVIDHHRFKTGRRARRPQKLCDEAKRYGFKTVCVNACNIQVCAAQLGGSSVVPIAVVGFPLGAGTANAKAFEAREAVRNGAQEIDMVINLGALKSKDYTVVLDDIAAVVAASAPKPVKVILETGHLDRDEKVIACALSKIAGAAFVKTSTGFGPGGATAEDIALMRATVGPEMGVKASGGVRTAEDVRAMVKAGATRVGASASVAIVSGQTKAPRGAKPRVQAGGY
ncbi:MAG: deoxyribose-phosphate aldolase [Myxococcota bacterium]